MIRRAAIGGLLALASAACGAPADRAASTGAPTASVVGPDGGPVPDAAPVDPVATAALSPPPHPWGQHPDRMIGAGPGAVEAALGTPDLTRREGPTDLWRYRAGDCLILIFLVQDASGAWVVDHFDTLDAARFSARPADACLAAALAAPDPTS